MIVLDTNVTSELMRPSPATAVVAWVHGARELHTTSVTLAELLYGIERLPTGRRRELLAATAREVFSAFTDRVLAFDAAAAAEYAELVVARERAGTPIDGFDAQIAAICRTHAATLATRNVTDFHGTGVNVVDPWTPPPR